MTFLQSNGRNYPMSHHILAPTQSCQFQKDMNSTYAMKKQSTLYCDVSGTVHSDNRVHLPPSKLVHAPCQANALPLHTDPEMHALRNMFSSHSSVGWSQPRFHQHHRLAYVEALVDTNAHVIETIWSSSTAQYNKSTVVPLRTFIQEVLKRSRTTYSTLQTALFYLFRARPAILDQLYGHEVDAQRGYHCWKEAYISCGRRMFLASLVVASKFVQDKTYRNSAWAKIAGLPVAEINVAERIFLDLIDYRLYVSQSTFQQWHHLLHMHVEARAHNRPTAFLHDLSCLTSKDVANHQQEMGWNTLSATAAKQQSPCEPPEPIVRKRRFRDSLLADERLPTAFLTISPPPSCSPSSVTFGGDSVSPHASNTSSAGSSVMPPVLSLSLPSSRSSSPMQTPTQVSPARTNHSTLTFTWKSGSSPSHHTGLGTESIQHRASTASGYNRHLSGDAGSSKRRRVVVDETRCNHGYAISHVRSMRRKQQRVEP